MKKLVAVLTLALAVPSLANEEKAAADKGKTAPKKTVAVKKDTKHEAEEEAGKAENAPADTKETKK